MCVKGCCSPIGKPRRAIMDAMAMARDWGLPPPPPPEFLLARAPPITQVSAHPFLSPHNLTCTASPPTTSEQVTLRPRLHIRTAHTPTPNLHMEAHQYAT